MPYEIHLPPRVYSNIEDAKNINIVESLTVQNNSIKVGNYYIPMSSILFIKEIVE